MAFRHLFVGPLEKRRWPNSFGLNRPWVRVGFCAVSCGAIGSCSVQEISLWRAVIQRALTDATRDLSRVPTSRERHRLVAARDEGRSWLTDGGADFVEVCSHAGVDSARIYTFIKALEAREWRFDHAIRTPTDGSLASRRVEPSKSSQALAGAATKETTPRSVHSFLLGL